MKMMNPTAPPSYLQSYHASQMQHAPGPGPQPVMMPDGAGGGAVPVSAQVSFSSSPTSGGSMQPQMTMHTPNATVMPPAATNGHLLTAPMGGGNAQMMGGALHMQRQYSSMHPSSYPPGSNIAMMKSQNPNKYGAPPNGVMMQTSMSGMVPPQNGGGAMIMTNGSMGPQQMVAFSNNNTVPYSPHGMYQQQQQQGYPMGGSMQQHAMRGGVVPKHMMANQMMMSPSEMAQRGMSPMSRPGPPNGMASPVMFQTTQMGSMNPQSMGQMSMQQQQQMYQGMMTACNQGSVITQPGGQSMQPNGVNAGMINRQQQQQHQQKMMAIHQHQMQQQQQQQQRAASQQMAMRQAITPPANLSGDSTQAMMMSGGYASAMGPNSMTNRQFDPQASSNAMSSGPVPSPVSSQQMTASTAMIGAPHSVPASHEVMPLSPQVQQNQSPGANFHLAHQQSLNSMGVSMGMTNKRQTTTPPIAPQPSARATPSPIQQRRLSSSASLKRRSSSTSSYDCTNPDPNKPNATAQPDEQSEPNKICRLSTGVDANPQSFSSGRSGNQNNSSGSQYSMLTICDNNGRKDSSCSSSNTDTHCSPDSGMGDSVGECLSSLNANPQTPLSRQISNNYNYNNNNNNNNNNSRCLNNEELLESLIQELGIEKLDHLPELVDIFDNDSVFSTCSPNSSPNLNQSSVDCNPTSKLNCMGSQRTTTGVGQKCP